MKKRILLSILTLFFISFGIISCNKSDTNSSDDSFVSAYAKTTISGIVFDDNHIPVQDAKVVAYGHVKYTDANGVFVFENLSVSKHRCFVTVEYNGYFAIMRSRRPIANGVTSLDAHLIQYNNGTNSQTDAFSTGTAYTINMSDGSSISFTAGTNFVDEAGIPYTGAVTVRTAFLDATTEDYSRQVPVGDQTGIDNHEEQLLVAQTGIIVELTDDNGKPLQLAEGSTASIVSQIPAALQAGAPATTPTYYASAANGYNNREGSATENAGQYEQTVGHFTYWSTQIASPDYGVLNCRVVDASGSALTGVRVQVGNAYGITGNNGTFQLRVPTNMNMDVAVRPLDFYGLSVVSSQPAWANREERTVELQLPNLDHVTGTLVDCNHNPIGGLVSLRWNSNISSIYTESGYFDLPTLSGAGSYELHVTSASKDTMFVVNVTTGVNSLGDISLCTPELPDIHNYVQVNQGDTLLLDYTNFYTNYDGHMYKDTLTLDPIRSYVEVGGTDGDFNLYLDGIYSVGTFDIQTYGASCYVTTNNPTQNYQVEDGTITITQYGPVGSKIKGTVDGTTMYNDGIHIEFEVIRSEDVLENVN